MHRYAIILILYLLTGSTHVYAQNNGHRPHWFNAMEGCTALAWDKARSDFRDLLDSAKQKGIPVCLSVKSDNFDVTSWLVTGKHSADELIMNFYCTATSDTATGKDNCTGALWIGHLPLSLR